jgi:hypothetical protein
MQRTAVAIGPVHHRGNADTTGIGRESEGHERTAGGMNQTAILPQAGESPARWCWSPETGRITTL